MEEKYKPITKAIGIATNGTFKVPGMVTLLGWTQKYDLQGRPLYADPNTFTGEINIEEEKYIVKTSGWKTKIIEAKTGEIYDEIDKTPDYVKEYFKKMEDGKK